MKLTGLLSAMSVLAAVSSGIGAEPAAKPADSPAAADGTVVLDENALWRHFRVAGATQLRKADGSMVRATINTAGHIWGQERWDSRDSSPLPPSDWAGPALDDSAWPRDRLPQPAIAELAPAMESRKAAYWPFDTVLTCLRAKFEVKNPARVKACRLSMDYWGGVVVYVNGKEALRRHIQAGATNLVDMVAEDYPAEAWTKADGKPMDVREDVRKKYQDRVAQRDRRLRDVEIPAALLRAGSNVVAIELHAAPVDARAMKAYWAAWAPIGLFTARLTVSPAGTATQPRPRGIHVWNVAPYDTVTAFDYGDATQALRPIVVRAARNTVFSGRLMVNSDSPIKGLKVSVTDLAQAGAKIPASAVQVRYAAPATPDKSWSAQHRFDGLLDAIPAEIPVSQAPAPGRHGFDYLYPFSEDLQALPKALVSGAMAPLWFTVRVPRDAQPGLYEGKVTVAAEGLAVTTVPLQVRVSAWTAPDPKDFRMQNTLYYAEEVQAKYYGVPYYSDKHLELIGKVLALAAEVNSRQVQANLAINFFAQNGESNPETLVRWIKQPDGTYKHDFTNFDRYLDMVAKSTGKPNTLRLNCWGQLKPKYPNDSGRLNVSVLDPATGKLDRLQQPPLGTEESYAFWKPVFDEALKKLKARGWLDAATFGYHAWSSPPTPVLVDIAHKLWPEGEWSWCNHTPREGAIFAGTTANIRMTCRHAEGVRGSAPSGKLPRLWQLDQPRRSTYGHTLRWVTDDNSPLREVRRLLELYIFYRGYDGTGEWGLDLFPLKKPAGGYQCTPAGRGTNWTSGKRTTMALLYPGPDGAVATERFEMFREGLELCEANLFIRNAAFKKKLNPDLQKRVESYVAERQRDVSRGSSMTRYMQAGEDAKLLELAGEVARELAK